MAAEANNVTLSTNFNVAPYYDDFDEAKNFHRILFRPGLAVQARELTQMQTILQNQIDRFASHIFQEGSTVRGLEMYYDTAYSYVKLRDSSSTGSSVKVSNFQDKIIKGATSGVLATVINVNDGSEANTPNFKTLFVKYKSANTTTGYRYFANNEIINTVGGALFSANAITSAQGGATGTGAAATFQSGVVYAKDHFIRVPTQTVIISKYDTQGSARVGFDVTETIVTEITDTTLLDPASGSYNYAAPGAARLKLEAPIRAYGLTAALANTFVELMQVKGGVVQSVSNRTQYSQIRDYMAGRTYDESGDYIVSGFAVGIRDHLKSGNNGGLYTSAQGGNTYLISVTADPGKAYVKGYDVDRIVSMNRQTDKGIDYQFVDSAKTLADYGNYVIVDNVVGNWDVNRQSVVTLRGQQANAISRGPSFFTTNFPTGELGTARVRAIKYYTGTPGLPSGQYKLYLTDVTMKGGYSFANVQSIGYNGGTGTTFGKADIILSNGKNANTKDSSFDRAVFRLPASATRRLRDATASINNSYWFEKSFPITFTTAGQYPLSTGDTTERFDGTAGTLSGDATRANFYVVCRGTSNTSTFSETLTTTGSNTVTASASLAAKLNPGDIINIHTQGGDFVVSAVNGTTVNLFGSTSGSAGAGKSFHKRFYPGQVLDFAGYGKSGSRSIVTSGTPLTTATLSLNEGTLGATLDATIVARLNKNDSQEESKTVQRNRYVGIRINAGGGTSYTANTTGPWPLGLSDGFKLVSVRKKTGSNFTTTTEGTDVTSEFTLDTGMNDNYYSHARLVKKSTSSLSIGTTDRLLVKLDYFTHSSSGTGFFSVDSYPVDDVNAGTDTTKIYTYEIPVFTSPTTGEKYDLRNCIDNRPRMTDTANSVTSLTNLSVNPKTSNTFVLPSGGMHFPPAGDDFTTDLSYYQPRVDVVGLTPKGALQIVRGVSSNKPAPPTVPEDMMPMAFVNIAPYPSLPEQLGRKINRPDLTNSVRKISNRRYTMKDIGQIAQRVDRLEYYTSLNLLEKSTRDLLVQDSNGLNRFKNGMLIDAFVNHAVGNVFDNDYKITIDPALGHMRPLITHDEIPLVYTSNSTNVVRSNVTPAGVAKDQRITLSTTPISTSFLPGATVTSGAITAKIRNKVGTRIYVEDATGNFAAAGSIISSDGGGTLTISSVKAMTEADNLVTLPYSHKVLVQQPYATTTRNTAGGSWKYMGAMTLSPDSDYWCDTVQTPDTNITLDQNTDAWKYLASTWPAQWNAPITTFVGSPVVTTTQTNTGTHTTTEGGYYNTYQDYTTTTTSTQQTQTTQTGNQTGVAINTNTQSFGNVVKDTSIIPYMRSRMIFVKVVGMKPSSRLYSFFDEVNVNAYVTPLTSAEYTSGLKDTAGNSVKPAATEGTALYSDTSGNVYAVFRLPNDTNLRFRTGTKRLRFVDNPTNSSIAGQFTTSAEGQYTAEGLSSEVSALTVTTKSVQITQTALTKTTQGSSSSSSTAAGSALIGSEAIPNDPDPPWEPPAYEPPSQDPLAQTFLITARQATKVNSSGMYLTKFDLYFATKHPTLPVYVELREVDNLTGNITRRTLPYAKVELAADDINVSDDASAPTPVYFPAPVYLADETEYAILVGPAASNPSVTVWTAVLGETDITTKNRISSQPATGFLFTSANDRTFTPVQDEDLKFTAYYAQFDTSSAGTLVVKNCLMDTMTIANTTGALNRAGEVVHGQTRLVGTFAPGNGLKGNTATSNSFVQGMVSGATGTIVSVSANHVLVKNVSIGAKFVGGEAVRFRLGANATHSPLAGNSTGAITSATYPTGRVYYYNNIDYANTRLVIANTSYVNSGAVFANNKFFLKDTYIKGQSNGYNARIVDFVNVTMDNVNLVTNMILPSNNDVKAFAKMATSTSARDASFFGLNINGDTEFSAPRYRLSRAVESNTAASSATMATNRSVEIKYTITGHNSIASPAIDLSRIALYSTHNLISTNAAIGSSEDYVKFGGSSQSRYITRTVTLADGQDAEDLRVYLTAYKPSGSNIFVYYKALNGDDNDVFADTRWIPMDLDTGQGFTSSVTYSSSEDKNNFLELTYKVPTYTNTARSGANTSTGVLEYRNSARARYVGFKYFAVKIVLVNSTSSNPPRVKDLRAIALQV